MSQYTSESVNIPKIIHQIWYQGEENIPKDYPNYSWSWKEKNPEYQYILWDQFKIENILNNYFPYFKKQYDSYPKIIQKIDVAKLMILYIYGGIYVDMDSECLRNIDPLLENNQIVLGKSNCDITAKIYNHGTIKDVVENSFFASIKNHPFWIHCIDMAIKENINKNIWETDEKYVFRTTGPSLITRSYYSFDNTKNFTLLDPIYLDPITPCEYYDYNCKENDCPKLFPNSYSIHHYGGTNATNGWMSPTVKNIMPYFCKYRSLGTLCISIVCILIFICIIYLFIYKF